MATNYYGTVALFRGVPLYNDYKDIILFTNYGDYATARALQLNWFRQYYVAEFNRLQYTRVGNNRIRLEGNAEEFYNINYCYFENVAHNTNGDPKYFFAFVLKVDYINDNVFEITYEIDVIQTWQFNFILKECFVEREHADSDKVGENLVKEPVEIGDYVVHRVDYPDADLTPVDLVLVDVPEALIPNSDGGGSDRTVIVGSARINENGEATGGQPGDQTPTGFECSTEEYYVHEYGWDLLRPNDPDKAAKIAQNMLSICNNNHIGYDMNLASPNLYAVSQNLNPPFDASLVTTDCNTNCSQAVRVCCLYAGIDVGDFYTGNEYSKLMATGEFTGYTNALFTSNPDNLRVGDILVTKRQAHTVVVVSIIGGN